MKNTIHKKKKKIKQRTAQQVAMAMDARDYRILNYPQLNTYKNIKRYEQQKIKPVKAWGVIRDGKLINEAYSLKEIARSEYIQYPEYKIIRVEIRVIK